MKARPLLFLLLILLLSAPGFAVGSDVPEIWTARRAIAFARQNSPDSQLVLQRMRQADALVQKAEVAFYPQLALFGSYSQTNNPMHSFGNILNQGEFTPAIDFNDPGRTDNLGVGVGVTYRFYNGGQDLAQKKAAEAGVERSSAETDAVLLQLEFNVFQAFQRIVQSGQIIQARQKALAAISSSLAVARSRFDAGELFKHDVLNLEVEQSQATENLVQAQHDLEMAKRVFLTLLGLPGDDLQIANEDDEGPVLPSALDPAQRPELKKLTAAVQAAESRLTAARGSRLPTVDGFARYNYDQGWVLDGHGDSWMAGVNVNVKVFDGHQSAADIALAEAQLGALRAEQRKLELALDLDVNQAKLALDLARQRQQVSRKMVEQAVASERLTKARFDAGVLLVSELIDSENRLTDARVRHVLASSAVRVAIADLRRAVGLPQYPADGNHHNSMEKQP
ncbi:MAG: TolC family protein [Desulfuromonadales bacterium]|jgi:outer membrane protein